MRTFAYADAAPRCQHIKINGEPCRAPALRHRRFCRFHHEASYADPFIPLPEDPASLQLALARIIWGLRNGHIPRTEANTILYALQIASSNLPRLLRDNDRLFASPPASDPAPTLPPPAVVPEIHASADPCCRPSLEHPAVTRHTALPPGRRIIKAFAPQFEAATWRLE